MDWSVTFRYAAILRPDKNELSENYTKQPKLLFAKATKSSHQTSATKIEISASPAPVSRVHEGGGSFSGVQLILAAQLLYLIIR